MWQCIGNHNSYPHVKNRIITSSTQYVTHNWGLVFLITIIATIVIDNRFYNIHVYTCITDKSVVIQSVGGGTTDGDKSPVITVATDSISKGELLNQ